MSPPRHINNRFRPIQIIHTFEGLANGLEGIEVMPTFGRPRPLDLTDFDTRVRAALEAIAARGIGGVAVNVGHDGYLESEEGWERFLRGLEMAVELGLRIWIYDENGYPSGSAGGLSLRGHPELEAIGVKRMRVAAGRPVALPDPRGRVLKIQPDDGGADRWVYFLTPLFEGTHADYKITSRKRYINVLDRRAVNRFLAVTHMRYYKRIPDRLWKHVQAVFTDEPSLMSHVLFMEERRTDYPSIPWSDGLPEAFFARHGYRLEDHLPSLFEGDSTDDKRVRRDFWGVVAELYEQAFGVQASEVCAAAGISLSGHLLAEESLWQHAVFHGDAISVLRHFQIPGLDILSCDPKLVNDGYVMTLKTAMSAAILGSKWPLMVEVSEWSEYWTEPMRQRVHAGPEWWTGTRKGNPIEHIEYTLALLFMAGVREFSFYFPWRAFAPDEYRRLCDFVALLNFHGQEARYLPTCGLYYPIEAIWEEYIPGVKDIQKGELAEQSDRCRAVNQAMADACKALFWGNIQYILVGRRHLSRLAELGIRALICPAGVNPDGLMIEACRRDGIEIVQFPADGAGGPDEGRTRRLADARVEAGAEVIVGRYDRFACVLSTGPRGGSFTLDGERDVIFPRRSPEPRKARGQVSLDAYEFALVIGR